MEAMIVQDLLPLARPIASLVPDPRNARTHGDKNLRAIKASLERFGQRKPVVVRRSDMRVLAGNGTLAAAQALGWDQLAAVMVDDSDPEAVAYGLADNRTAELAEWDEEQLAELVAELEAADAAEGLGWSDRELARLVDTLERAEGDDAGPGTPPAEPVSREGEVYQLGPHRLACGDSRDPAVWARLMRDERVVLVATDPPYGVDYSCTEDYPREKIANDALGLDGTRDLVRAALRAIPCAPGAALYAASPSGVFMLAMLAAWEGTGFAFRHSLVWLKDQLVIGRGDYHYRHETILYGWREDGPHYFTADRTQDSVFVFPNPKKSPEHPTMKPVDLYRAMVRNSSRPGDLVADPFGGSGTTLLACAQEGRACRMVELAPAFCDVIRRRWGAWARSLGLAVGDGL